MMLVLNNFTNNY